jgi:hypothetical protein
VRLEGLNNLKKKKRMTSSGLESATFQLVAQRLNHPLYRALHSIFVVNLHFQFEMISVHAYECKMYGHAVTRVVSPRLPTAATLVRARVKSCEICGAQSGISVFPAKHSTYCSTLIIRSWYNKPSNGLSISRLCSTPLQKGKWKYIYDEVNSRNVQFSVDLYRLK